MDTYLADLSLAIWSGLSVKTTVCCRRSVELLDSKVVVQDRTKEGERTSRTWAFDNR